MYKTLKTIILSDGCVANLIRESQKEIVEYECIGYRQKHYDIGKIREYYKIIITDLDLGDLMEFDVFVYRDSTESWRKPIAQCHIPKNLEALLSDYHIEEPDFDSSIDGKCRQAIIKLGFWIEDRANYEIAQMKL